ncbi:MAG TPA: SOS response-associated peptidase [Burkholderiales bacterium]|nr:SOS response-associated peptidase [Burkholderiales bacterium]
MLRMCGRYELHTPVEEVARRFDAALTDEARALPPRYNIAPSLRVPVLRQGRRGREIEAMTWGLIPSWAKDRSGVKPINARAETVFERPMFRNAIARRRCLLPADGFYEWRRGQARKQPYHIGMADGSLLALAGVWEYWAREGEQPLLSCAIVVTDANPLMAAIHERMPVIVAPPDSARWLDPALSDRAAIETMLSPFPAELMRAYPISTRVNDAKNDYPELIEPA